MLFLAVLNGLLIFIVSQLVTKGLGVYSWFSR